MMPLQSPIAVFLHSDSGAVSVDWVVLAAAVVGLGVGSVAAVRTGTSAMGDNVETALTSAEVVSLPMLGDDGYTGPWAEPNGVERLWYTTPPGPCGKSGCPPDTEWHEVDFVLDDGTVVTRRTVTTEGSEPDISWYGPNGTLDEIPRIR